MSRANKDVTPFEVSKARSLVGDLFKHSAAFYWTDFIVSLILGYGGALTYMQSGLPLGVRVAGFFIGGFALYRIASFMHEIVHLRKGELKGFATTWNVLAGVPMLMPTLFYECHNAHHNTHYYGTGKDGEYLPLGNGTWGNIGLFMLQVLLQPLFVVFRFLILTPLSAFSPAVRRWTLERASSFVINLRFKREFENPPHVGWAWMEFFCFIRTAAIFVEVAIVPEHWPRIFYLYGIAVFILGLNYVRTLSAHFYLGDGTTMSHHDQFFDSTVITGNAMTELLCPVGLRYHALHHLFPRLPYHNLGAAHKRMLKELPANSEYHTIVFPTFFSIIRQLARNVRNASQQPQSIDEWYSRDSDEGERTAAT